MASDAGGPVGGYGNRKNSGNSTSAEFQTQAVGTTISAGSLQTVSGRDTALQAATVVADRDITMMAGRNLTIESAQNTEFSSSSSANAKSGFIGSWSQPGLGHIKDFGAQTTSRTTQQASQVASLTGNVTLVAGNEYRQTASSVMAAGQAGSLAGGDVNILAKNVTINEAYNTEQSMTVQRSSSSKLGGSASFMGISTDSLRNAQSTVRAMEDTKGNGRMQALGAINLAMSGKQAYDAVQAIGSGGPMSYGVSVTASRNTSQATSFSNSSTAVGSSITGANNVNIVSTGAGADSNIHAVGSTIAAGNTVNLAADNDITLEASKNTSVSVGQNSSHGTSVGVTFGAGAQNGFSIQLGVQNGKGRDNQNETTYNATQVSGGNAVNVSSGRNLTLNGATIEGNRVTADVGGDLNIASLQDVSVGQSRQSSGGFGVSLCIPPICYGAVATVSANSASAKANGVFISPAVQAGIKAGDGGFDVNVKGNTNLTGAVIESTQAAIDNNKNSFATGGALTMSDLQNVSQSSGSSYSVSGSASVGQTTNPNATPQQRATQNQLSQPGIKPGGAGVGSYSGNNQSSVTRSGISGIAGDQSVRTGDNRSAGTLIKDWNTQTIIRNVQAQAQITQQFGPVATGFWAGIANEQLRDAQAREDQDAIKCWSADGMCRAAGHAVIGGLTGGAAGATGAVLSTQIAPLVNQIAEEYGLSETSRTLVVAGLTTAVGAAVGGAAVAAGAFNEVTNNFLTGRQVAQKEKELADCQKVGNCKAVVDKWDRIDLEQQDLLDKLHRAELAVLKEPSEENSKGLSDAKKAWANLYEKFRSEGDTGGMKFVKDVYFTANLNYQLMCARTSSCVPPTRSEIMTGLAMNIDIALATDGAMAGIARSVVNGLSGRMIGDSVSPSTTSTRTVELFTNESGPKVPGAAGVGPKDPNAVASDARNMPNISSGSQVAVVANNPYIPTEAGGKFSMMDYLPEAARITQSGGTITINGNQSNKYFSVQPTPEELNALGLKVVYQGSLLPEYRGYSFAQTDGKPIPLPTLKSIVFVKK